ncbi:glycosyltransferase [Niallia circulans]|uniref:glycosyltransferase n=2 Tax=Niallia circulans TaxID=1397 RepID=UPI00397A088E
MSSYTYSLNEELNKKKWDFKKKEYIKCFEKAERQTIINNPRISIVIISWRRHPDTIKNIQILQKQRCHNFELIFVNNGGSDEEFIEVLPFVDTYIKLNKNTGAYLARNVGAVFANGPILLFLEDDGIPDIQLVESHLLTFEVYDVICVRGVYLPKINNNILNTKQNHYYHGNKFFPSYIDLEGNASINAEAFYRVGGWDDNITFGHGGPDLSIRLLEYEPDMKKQIYSPISIILHDYANNEEHLHKKLEKQRISKDRLKGKHKNWESLLFNWRNLYQLEQKVLPKITKRTGVWEEVEILKKKIFNRNEEFLMDDFNDYFFYLEDTDISVILKGISHGNICIFGAGELGKLTYSFLKGLGIKIKNFYDNNPKHWDSFIENVVINDPSQISFNEDFIIIASSWYREISFQLESKGYKRGENFLIVNK